MPAKTCRGRNRSCPAVVASGGNSRAFNSTKLPTAGAVPFFTDSRTRSSFVVRARFP